MFVTYRLAGSLPVGVFRELEEASRREAAALVGVPTPPEDSRHESLVEQGAFTRWDAELDRGQGTVWLAHPEVASLVAQAMHHFENLRYELHAYCIMPNHVHMVLTPLPMADESYYTLASIMHSLKSYTANRANQVLGRSGTFWQDESYDHFVRDARDFERIIRYVIGNPAKAGLVEDWLAWPWTYCRDEL